MADIFISYAREDRPKVQLLAEAFEGRGWSVWWDTRLKAGEVWDDVIERELSATRCVVVLWSKTSVQKYWVRVEASEGRARQILVPAFIDDVQPPLAFRLIQAEHLIDWSGDSLHPGLNRLFVAVSERLRAQPAVEAVAVAARLPKRRQASGRANTSARVDAPLLHVTQHFHAQLPRAPSLITQRVRLKLEFWQREVRAPDYHFDDSHLKTLRRLEKECWSHDEVLGFYASLLLAYSLLKGGAHHCVRHKSRLIHIRSLAEESHVESMAAHWLLGRIDLSMASIADNSLEKERLFRSAHEHLSAVEPVTLHMPIPLRGAKEECPEEDLDTSGDPAFAPVVITLPKPHRYIAAGAISLAALGNFTDTSLLANAHKHCVEMQSLHADGTAPRLNIDVVDIMEQSISRGRLGKGEPTHDICRKIEHTISEITTARQMQVISSRKEKEWLALCYASLAVTTKIGLENGNAIYAMRKNVADFLNVLHETDFSNYEIPDVLFIDPVYRLAIEQRNEEEFSEFIQELSPYKITIR